MSTYPGTIDSFSAVAGTTLVSVTQTHSSRHNTEGSAIVAIENVLGTTGGTSVFKNFTAGNFAEREGTLTFGANRLPLGTTVPTSGQFLVYNGTEVVGSAGLTSPLTTKGDLFTRNSTADARLAVGADSRILSADSSQATGLSWISSLNSFQIGTLTTNRINSQTSAGIISFGNGIVPPNYILTDNVGAIDMTFGGTAAPQQATLIFGTASGTRTIGAPSAINNEGFLLTLRVKQNAAATGVLAWNSVFRFPLNVASSAGTLPSGWNIYKFAYGTTDAKWDLLVESKNL